MEFKVDDIAYEPSADIDEDLAQDDSIDQDQTEEGLGAATDEDFVAANTDKTALAATDLINLQLSCDIGAVSLSLAQINKLVVGDYVEFNKWPSKVKLRLNGSLFAEGYLVEINGMIGVKITNKLLVNK